MSTDLDKFIQETADYLAMRDKEAGVGTIAKNVGRGSLNLVDKGRIALQKGVDAGQKSVGNILGVSDAGMKNVLAPGASKIDKLKSVISGRQAASTADTLKAAAPKRPATGIEPLKKALMDNLKLQRRSANVTGVLQGSNAEKTLTSAIDSTRKALVAGGMKAPAASEAATTMVKDQLKNPSLSAQAGDVMHGVMDAPLTSIGRGTSALAKNKGVQKGTLLGGTGYGSYKGTQALASALDPGSESPADAVNRYVSRSVGTDPDQARAATEFASKDIDTASLMAPKPTGAPPEEDTSEGAFTMDKLTDYGKDAFNKIQDFASTRAGSGVLGATTGAGLAYLIDKMTTDGDEDEDKVRNRRVITSLLGALGGAAAGMGIQHYMGQQKTAMDNPAKVQSLLQQEATAMSDEELEQKVTELEMREKTASAKDFIHRRLRVVFQPQFAA